MSELLKEVPLPRPSVLKFPTPKKTPFFLVKDPQKEFERKKTFIKFLTEKIQIGLGDSKELINYPTNLPELIAFLKRVNPGYHQSFNEEHLRTISILSKSQRSDLKETTRCYIGESSDYLELQGSILQLTEVSGKTVRHYLIQNVTHLNNYEEMKDEVVTGSISYEAYKLNQFNLNLYSSTSIGSEARSLILNEAPEGFFPLYLLKPEHLGSFYDSVKGPMFRSFVLGDSPNVESADLENCYLHIMGYTPSPNPNFCQYISDTSYHPEAAFASCRIWIDLDCLEVTPVGIRLLDIFSKEKEEEGLDLFNPAKYPILYPYGHIKEVNINLPLLWYLIEFLKLRLGKDLGILGGTWAIPHGEPIYPWKDWARKILQAQKTFPSLKSLYQLGPTGGRYTKKIKTGEFKYSEEECTLTTENPIILSHIFDLTRVLVLLGTSTCKKVKNAAADGWTAESGSPDILGPIKIGCSTYGPFPVRKTHLDLLYQFTPLLHDEIVSLDNPEEAFWRPRVEEFPNSLGIDYRVTTYKSFKEVGVDHPEDISRVYELVLHKNPSTGDRIPEGSIEVNSDTLGNEIKTRAPDSTEVRGRLKYITEPYLGRSKHGKWS